MEAASVKIEAAFRYFGHPLYRRCGGCMMIEQTVKTWVSAAMLILLMLVPALAEKWTEHGSFVVSSSTLHGGLKACEIQVSSKFEKESFSMIWIDVVGPAPLVVGYQSIDSRLAQAERVVVTIDSVEIFSFMPLSHSVTEDSTSVTGPVRDAAAAWEAMRQVAVQAKWLTIAAGDSRARVPAEGLRGTLADLAECRRQRNL